MDQSFSAIPSGKTWKYAREEREVRFLLPNAPEGLYKNPHKKIHDRYLSGTRMRLRKTVSDTKSVFKLTKKIPLSTPNAQWISTIYLSEAEYDLFAKIPGDRLYKRRFSLKHPDGLDMGIDEIVLGKEMIWIAEIEIQDHKIIDVSIPFPGAISLHDKPKYAGNRLAIRYQKETFDSSS